LQVAVRCGGYAGGGGAGGYTTDASLAVSAATNYTITIGAGGAKSHLGQWSNGSIQYLQLIHWRWVVHKYQWLGAGGADWFRFHVHKSGFEVGSIQHQICAGGGGG
jgi:hypothetical protein